MESLPVLLGVTLISFLLLSSTSGDLAPGLELNPNLKQADILRIRHNLGLDLPWQLQYVNWLGLAWAVKAVGLGAVFGNAPISTGLLEGDFGRSLVDGTAIAGNILARLPNTLELTVTAIAFGILVAIPLGITGALRRGSKVDHALTVISTSGIAIPHFWLGVLLILFFSVTLQSWGLPFLPSGGVQAPVGGGDVLDRLAHLAMPAFVLSLGYLAVWSRYMRSSMLEILNQDYIRTARAKGMINRRVIYRHALRNAIIPLVTLVGLELPSLLGAGLLTEIVFAWPGIGRYAFESAIAHDITSVMATVTIGAVLVVVGNLLADLLYAVLDPRIRY